MPGAPSQLIAITGICGSVAVTVHGAAQPPLADETGALPGAAASLLGVNPPFP